MGGMENQCSHPVQQQHGSGSASLSGLARLPGLARARLTRLARNPFARFMEDGDGRDENDIYRRTNVSGRAGGG